MYLMTGQGGVLGLTAPSGLEALPLRSQFCQLLIKQTSVAQRERTHETHCRRLVQYTVVDCVFS